MNTRSGPFTITVTGVKISAGTEQPVSIEFENGAGKVYRPCKSMSRVLVANWGADAKQYIGRSLTLYRDPSVKWAGMDVGGIRVSHMSDIESAMTMALTATKGSRKPFTVKPLVSEPEIDWKARIEAAATLDELGEIWKACPAKSTHAAVKDRRKVELTGEPK